MVETCVPDALWQPLKPPFKIEIVQIIQIKRKKKTQKVMQNIWLWIPEVQYVFFNCDQNNVDVQPNVMADSTSKALLQFGEDSFDAQMREELARGEAKTQRKNWNQSQLQLLEALRKQGQNWNEISQRIPGTNHQTCKRKYERIMAVRKKWPQALDARIIELHEKGEDWEEITRILKSQALVPFYKKQKEIKERYQFYLRPGISHQGWGVEEDMLLFKASKHLGNKWSEITKYLPHRTELQLKNRFYSALLPIAEKLQQQGQKSKQPNQRLPSSLKHEQAYVNPSRSSIKVQQESKQIFGDADKQEQHNIPVLSLPKANIQPLINGCPSAQSVPVAQTMMSLSPHNSFNQGYNPSLSLYQSTGSYGGTGKLKIQADIWN